MYFSNLKLNTQGLFWFCFSRYVCIKKRKKEKSKSTLDFVFLEQRSQQCSQIHERFTQKVTRTFGP